MNQPVPIKSTDQLPAELTARDAVYVHPTSIIDAGAEVGGGTVIWHFCHLMPGCRVGTLCHIGQNVVIQGAAELGSHCRVLNNVTLYRGVHCSDGVFLGPSCVFTNVVNPRAFINRKSEIKPTFLEEGVSVGANATILCGIRIGAYALIGAGSVVVNDVPAHALMVGNPAKQIGWVSRDGYRLTFVQGEAFCAQERRTYLLDSSGRVTLREGTV